MGNGGGGSGVGVVGRWSESRGGDGVGVMDCEVRVVWGR